MLCAAVLGDYTDNDDRSLGRSSVGTRPGAYRRLPNVAALCAPHHSPAPLISASTSSSEGRNFAAALSECGLGPVRPTGSDWPPARDDLGPSPGRAESGNKGEVIEANSAAHTEPVRRIGLSGVSPSRCRRGPVTSSGRRRTANGVRCAGLHDRLCESFFVVRRLPTTRRAMNMSGTTNPRSSSSPASPDRATT